MNQALSAKGWWPGGQPGNSQLPDDATEEVSDQMPAEKPKLKLVTENYQ